MLLIRHLIIILDNLTFPERLFANIIKIDIQKVCCLVEVLWRLGGGGHSIITRNAVWLRGTLGLSATSAALCRFELGGLDVDRVLEIGLGTRRRKNCRINRIENLIHDISVVDDLLLRSTVHDSDRADARVQVARGLTLFVPRRPIPNPPTFIKFVNG